MRLLEDVWVNLVDVEEVGAGLRYFHEWGADEAVLMDRLCLYEVSSEFVRLVSEKRVILSEGLLREVYQQSYERKGRGRKRHDYTFLLCDGVRAFVVEANGEGIIERKSDLMPRQLFSVLEEVSGGTLVELPEVIGEYEVGLCLGMTRRELEVKKLILGALDRELEGAGRSKLLYYCTELVPSSYKKSKDLDESSLKKKIYDEFYGEWSTGHDEFCKVFVELNIEYKKEYDKLVVKESELRDVYTF